MDWRTCIERTLGGVLGRIECQGWQFVMDIRTDYIRIAAVRPDRPSNVPPLWIQVRNMDAHDIITDAFEAIVAAERQLIRERFTYRGQDILSPRFYLGRDILSPRNSLRNVVAEVDEASAVHSSSTAAYQFANGSRIVAVDQP